MHTYRDKPLILAVDDVPENIDVIKGILTPDYTVAATVSGAIALKIAHAQRPDLILLDVMMPDMDGHEVCRRLKADEATRDIPIIFVTALGEEKNEVAGLELGAVDYVTKPISPQTLRARVSAHQRLARIQKELDIKNRQLEEERQVIEELILRMRQDPHLDMRYVRSLNESLERTGGDMVLSAFRPDGAQHVLVGDFTGHGLPAAIGGPLVSHLFQCTTQRGEDGAKVLQEINSALQQRLPVNLFMAAALVEISPDRGLLRCWNAGLPDMLLLQRDGQWRHAHSSLLPLGISEAIDSEALLPVQFTFSTGDSCYLLTDGVTELQNQRGEQFGEDRLKQALQGLAGREQLVPELRRQLNAFTGDSAKHDDLTLVEICHDR